MLNFQSQLLFFQLDKRGSEAALRDLLKIRCSTNKKKKNVENIPLRYHLNVIIKYLQARD